ncbi:MAG: methyltransferase [Pseudomonadota bacterium]
MLRSLCLVMLLLVAPFSSVHAMDKITHQRLMAAINGDHRGEDAKARDAARHPHDTLEFLGFTTDMTVVEIWPGGGWYTEILGPALAEEGKLYAAHFEPNSNLGFVKRSYAGFLNKLAASPELYKTTTITHFDFPHAVDIAPLGSADLVLTFRNVHNWMSDLFHKGGFERQAFALFYDTLKPGGILGVVEHRWPDDEAQDPKARNGYVSEAEVIALAKRAGFEFVGKSEVNANPKDTKDHPRGVWTLPPGFALGDEDREKYAAIGESDRMTLKFRKPE